MRAVGDGGERDVNLKRARRLHGGRDELRKRVHYICTQINKYHTYIYNMMFGVYIYIYMCVSIMFSPMYRHRHYVRMHACIL